MEYQRTINELATWEIDSMIEMYGNKLLNLFPSLFDEYPKSIPKLHKRRNSFSNDEYDRFVSCPVLPYSELIDTIKYEPMTDRSVLESPLFDEDCISSPDSYGIRIPLKSKISSTFQISYCLEYFESEVLEGRCKEGNVTFVAGELNHKSYGELKNYYFDLILGKGLKTIKHIDCFAGPHLSCPNNFQIDKDPISESNFFVNLFLNNQYQDKIRIYKTHERKEFHFIVHEYNNKLCLIEDPHPEFSERAATVVFNNPALCNMLRDMAQSYYSDSVPLLTEEDIRACLMTENEIKKESINREKQNIIGADCDVSKKPGDIGESYADVLKTKMSEIDLRSILIKNGCTQVDFSIKAGMGIATINRIYNDGDYNLSPRIKNKIRKALIELGYITKSDWVA